MKLFSILTLTGLASALATNNTTTLPTCCVNTLSCSIKTDGCCSPTYGLVVLALQWFPTLGPKDEFTVHGLWPDECDGTFAPSDGCDASRKYTDQMEAIVKSDIKLYDEMNLYWASYKGNNPSFWAHEWGKHGTCVTTLEPRCYKTYEPYQEVRDYMKSALALRKKFDLYSALKKSNIVPGRTYNLTEIDNALINEYKVKIHITCSGKKLNELRLFFRVKGKDNYILTNTVGTRDSCPKTGIQYDIKTGPVQLIE